MKLAIGVKKDDYSWIAVFIGYLNDIIDRNRIQNEEQIGAVVEILASSVGSLTNPLKLSNTFRTVVQLPIADKTVSNFLTYLEDAFLISRADRYEIKGGLVPGTQVVIAGASRLQDGTKVQLKK